MTGNKNAYQGVQELLQAEPTFTGKLDYAMNLVKQDMSFTSNSDSTSTSGLGIS